MINQSQRPVLYFGGGVASSGAGEELHQLMEKAEIPAVHTLMAAGVLSYDDPMNLGLLGMHGSRTANLAVDRADLVLAVGTRFSDRGAQDTKKFAPDAKIIQIDIDQSEINKNVVVDLGLVGDIKQVLTKLLPQIEQKQHTDWKQRIQAWQAEDYKPADDDTVLKPHQVIGKICEIAGDDSILVTDVGQHQMWAIQYCKRVKPNSFLTSGGLGTMGYGLGAAIGGQFGCPDKRVVLVSGDGSFHMNLNELTTLASYNLPIVVLVMNNRVLGMVRQWQDLFYEKRYSATVLDDGVDYVKLAEAMGATGYRATTREAFNEALKAALAAKTPVVIDCVIGCDDKVWPMVAPGADISTAFTGEDLVAVQS